MPQFKYIVKTKRGEVRQGQIEAPEVGLVETILKKKGYLVVNLEKVESSSGVFVPFWSKIGVKDKAVFVRQLATMLEAGIAMSDAFNVSISQTDNSRFKQILADISKKIESGYSLSKSLGNYPKVFDRVFVSVVESGEATGKLPKTLNQLAHELEEQESVSSKFKAALAYPLFILLALIGAVSVLMIYVVPQLKNIFESSQMALPLSTKILLSVSSFIGHWWWLILLLAGAVVVIIYYWIRGSMEARIYYDKFKLNMPLLGSIIEESEMSRMSNMLSLLLGTGIPILSAIRLASRSSENAVYQEAMVDAAKEVERGVPLSTPLDRSGVFPKMFTQMIRVGEEAGEVSGILNKLAHYYRDEVNTKIKLISSLLEPIIIVILGLAVGFVVFSIIIPIYQISMVGI